MSTTDSDSDDAITKEEIKASAPAPPASSGGITKATASRNAFTELMKPKPKASSTSKPTSSTKSFRNRDGLGAYTADPASFSPKQVIYFNDDFVVINDLYPKSSVHALLLPRRSDRNLQHPFDAFEDSAFLATVQAEALKLKRLVANELQRRFGKDCAADQLREAVLDGDVPWESDAEPPPGRDWAREVKVGVHAHPSMNHLHVHVLSRDMSSECMKHRKHYNSFNTPFLIDITDFPLAKDDPKRHAKFLNSDLKCWRCGENFGNKFKQLKEHLALEFEAWKKG